MIFDSPRPGGTTAPEHLYAVIDALHPRCPDEHRMDWAACNAVKIDIGFEGLNLTTEGIASYGDIECPESLLIFGAVQHPLGEQDHPGTGAVRRQSCAQRRYQWLAQPEDPRQLVDRGGLTTGQHNPTQPG